MSGEEVVRVENLTVRFGRVKALREVTLSFGAGAWGLLGRNGAGKTTLLRALLGLVPPATGRLRVLGREDRLFIRAHVGYMPEGFALFPGMTGFAAVAYAGRLAGLARRVAKRRAHEMLYFAGLGESRYRPLLGFSTGMVQRVKLAMALVGDPALVFLDEPTNGLDPGGRREMLARIKDLAGEKGKAVVLSSHILADVEDVCSQAVLLDEGRVSAQGAIRELTAAAERTREVLVKGAGDGLEPALERAGYSLHASRREGDLRRLRVGLPPGKTGKGLLRVLVGAGCQVRSFVEVRRPLEEIFSGSAGKEG